jgi:hypothetical protein
VIQPEPFRLRDLGDGEYGHSLVIPLPRGRALRIGLKVRAWCKIGPRRYAVIASKEFVESVARFGVTEDDLRGRGWQIEGGLSVVTDA